MQRAHAVPVLRADRRNSSKDARFELGADDEVAPNPGHIPRMRGADRRERSAFPCLNQLACGAQWIGRPLNRRNHGGHCRAAVPHPGDAGR